MQINWLPKKKAIIAFESPAEPASVSIELYSIEHSEIKVIRQSGLFEARSDL